MKIKAKLLLGIGLLFFMIVVLTILSVLYINKLSGETKNILVDNYNTLDYSRKMLIALNDGIAEPASAKLFSENLARQQQNITEAGEKELTDKLAGDFSTLSRTPGDTAGLRVLRTDITDIMLLNMLAIQRKSAVAADTAGQSILWVSIAGTLCFLIAFVVLVNLPGNIANPVKELTESIKAIAAQNYSQRIHFDNKNEFGELAAAFNTMAQKLEEYKAGNIEKLMLEKKRIETLINNMNDPVIGMDDKGMILFMNGIALQVAGLKAEEVTGKQAEEIALRNDLVRSLLRDLYYTGDEGVNSRPLPVKIYADDKESYFEKQVIPIRITPTGETQERSVGNVILLQNITPYKELDSAKTNFIATVSHELKTPISSIKMSLQLLENKKIGELNAEQQQLLESIKDDASRLLKITGELLNMTQVESGIIQLAVTPADPREMLNYAINANRTAAEQKQISFDVNIPGDLPPVMADSEKTAWVLTNLISNAIRYSYDNAVINLAISKDNNKVHFSVTDTGRGIAPQYIDKIFDRYFRIPGSQKEGTGLGLSISKEFIEAEGGHITVASDFGAGSTFTITLPIA